MKDTYSMRGRMVKGAVAAAAGLLIGLANADDKKAGAGAGAPNMAEMMKKMEELAAPGPEHRMLASMTGQWEAEAHCFMAGPDAPATLTKGTCKSTMILGGRFLQEEFEGDMMGKKFTGVGLMGYDKFNKKYVNVWMDDMGTGVFTSEGTADASGKVITLHGKMDDPMTDEKAKPMRLVTRIVSQACFRNARRGAGSEEQSDGDHLRPENRHAGGEAIGRLFHRWLVLKRYSPTTGR